MSFLFGATLAIMGVKIPLATVFEYGPVIAITLFNLPSFISLLRQRRVRGLLAFVFIALIAFGAQVLAVHTHFISGKYSFDTIIGRQLLGVPWVVALAYPPVVLGTYWLARKLQSGFLAPLLTAAFVTVIGTVLEPIAVKLEFWKWEHGGAFWGVPPANFAAWFLTGLLAAFILHKLWGDKPVKRGLAFSLLGILLFWTGANLGTDQWIPAAIGGAASILFLVVMWREKHRPESKQERTSRPDAVLAES